MQRIQKLAARDNGLTVTPEELQEKLGSYAFLFTQEGKQITTREYERRIAQIFNMSKDEFENAIASEILISKYKNFVAGWVTANENEIKDEYIKQFVKAKIDIVKISTTDTLKDITLTDKDIEEYYNKHKDDFKTTAKRKLKYLIVKADDFIKDIPASDAEVQKYYQQNQNSFKEDEQVKARHILLRTANKDENEIKKQAEALYNRIKAGEDFAALAKQYSEDPSSAVNGGDLGYFSKGRMIKEFEEAAFSLKNNEVSQPVKTLFGYHIIKVEDHKPAGIKSLFAVQNDIKKQLALPKAREFATKKMNEIYQWIKSNNAKDLSEVNTKLNYPVKTSEFLAESDTSPELTSMIISTAFKQTLNEISAPVNFSSDSSIIVQTAEIKQPEVKPFADVKSEAETKAKEEKANTTAKMKLDELKASLATETDLKKAAESKSLTAESPDAFAQDQPIPIIGKNEKLSTAIFNMKVGDLSELVEYPGGVALFKLTEKHLYDEKEFKEKKASIEKDVIDKKQSQFYNEVLQKIRTKYQPQIERNESLINSIIAS